MDNKEIFEILCKNINYIILDDNICYGIFELKKEKSIFDNEKLSNRLYLNNSIIKIKNTKVNYKCPVCENIYTIYLKKFLNKKTLNCVKCKELLENKRINQSLYMKSTFKENNRIKPKKIKVKKDEIDNITYINNSNFNFNNETNEFKIKYYDRILNLNEYSNLKKNIYSVNGFIFNENMIYYEHLMTNNQMKYSSYLYNPNNNKFINLNNINLICENCNKIFNSTRKPKEKIKKHKILCKDCNFCNNTFKIRNTHNINNNIIIYQSNTEKILIDFCNNNNILIENGPKLKYFFNNKEKTYKVDFLIPEYNYLIEIKDNHIWHRKQVESGKWEQKENIANKYANENKLFYKIIFTQDLKNFLTLFKI